MKQVSPTSGNVPPFTVEPLVGEGGQLAARVDPNDDEVVEITPNMPPSVLAKRKHDNGARVSDHKKSRALFSL